jgi:hypothetical protein
VFSRYLHRENTELKVLTSWFLHCTFEISEPMEYFEINIKDETYKIIPNNPYNYSFSVFNYATCHTIERNSSGMWKDVEHRFGMEDIPLNELGEAIDKHYSLPPQPEGLKS